MALLTLLLPFEVFTTYEPPLRYRLAGLAESSEVITQEVPLNTGTGRVSSPAYSMLFLSWNSVVPYVPILLEKSSILSTLTVVLAAAAP